MLAARSLLTRARAAGSPARSERALVAGVPSPSRPTKRRTARRARRRPRQRRQHPSPTTLPGGGGRHGDHRAGRLRRRVRRQVRGLGRDNLRDRVWVGDERRARRVRDARHQRRAPQPGGDVRARRDGQESDRGGAAVHPRAARRRHRRCRRQLRVLRARHRRLRGERRPVRGAAGSAASYAGPRWCRTRRSASAAPRRRGERPHPRLPHHGSHRRRHGLGPDAAAPPLIGATAATLICTFGPVTGCGMNPAATWPAAITLFAGWGTVAAEAAGCTLGPVAGAILGATMYDHVPGVAPRRRQSDRET